MISLCKADLNWLPKDLTQLRVMSITIYSKCRREDIGQKFLQEFGGTVSATKIVSLPNVGRVDHNIAHFFNNMSADMKFHPDGVILFIKDTFSAVVHQPYQEKVSLEHMVIGASTSTLGFQCGLRPVVGGYGNNLTVSMWHDTSSLMSFRKAWYRNKYDSSATDVTFESGHNFSEWAEEVGIKFPTPLTPVCYGGNFAVKQSNIARLQQSFVLLEQSLSRGDNIVEGHYSERSWAAILTPQIPENVSCVLQSMTFEVYNGSLVGALIGGDTAKHHTCEAVKKG